MASPATTSQIGGIYETLGELIQNPKSLGLREHLPPRVLAVLTSTREVLLQQMNDGKQTAAADNDLAAELSQDSDTRLTSSEEQQRIISFRSTTVPSNGPAPPEYARRCGHPWLHYPVRMGSAQRNQGAN